MMNELKLHRHIGAMVAAFDAAGYKVSLSHDPSEYRRLAASVVGYNLTSPLDTAFVDIESRFILLRVEEKETGKLVAIETGRSLSAPKWRGGLNALLLNRRFFGTKQIVLPVIERAPAINLHGRLCYMGGAWVEKAYRSSGVMSLLAKLTMAHLVRCFSPCHIFGLVRAHHAGLALMPDGYSFNTATEVRWAYWSPNAAPETLYLISVDREALLERYEASPAYAMKTPGQKTEKTVEQKVAAPVDSR